uniref:60S ribosome subunit biogenesis protein NIP7 homolog n=1 Tax=Anopheles dirus TaxID=7168 RepID=A0A182NGC9_9DIPT
MKRLSDQQTKVLFEKLSKYIGTNVKLLIDRTDGTYCFREMKSRVYYMSEKILKLSETVPNQHMVSVGTCFGKFTKGNKFILHITALAYLAPYAQYKIWLKPAAEQQFLYGNNVAKSGMGRITENTPVYQGVIVMSMSDVPLGFVHTSGIYVQHRKLQYSSKNSSQVIEVASMNRETVYYLPEGSTESTFCYDEDRPRLPLPKLDHTLKRYLESLKPFGTDAELENTKKIIETFRKGVGAKLQAILEEKAAKEKNWRTVKLTMKLASIVVLAVVAVGVSALPRPDADLREKLHQYLALIPEDIRTELENAIRNHQKPSEAFFDKVREQLLTQLQENQRFREFAEQKYNQFLGLLTPDLRDDVDNVVQNWVRYGGVPHADEELREKVQQHFAQLKLSHFEDFLAKLPPRLREQVKVAMSDAQQGHPHFNPELREAVDKWWEDYAYCTLRLALIPYCVMVQPLLLDTVGIAPVPENFLKGSAVCLHHNMVFWKLLRTERLRPIASADKRIVFSADLYRRLYNTVRTPGVEMDKVESYFRTEKDGPCPSHLIVLYDGRIFKVPGLDANGDPLSPQDFLFTLQQIQVRVEGESVAHAGVPVLTNDDRTTWARNRQHLTELSARNKEMVREIEEAVALLVLDTNCPTSFSDLSQLALTGDLRSKWTDKSCGTIAFKNGQMGCYGEHCCYDGSISMSISLYVMMSIAEEGVPDWSVAPKNLNLPEELIFDLDEPLREEVARMEKVAEEMKNSVIVSMDQFQEYGKAFMKKHKIHPDAYVQTALLLTYYRLHGTFAPTYETAMMRQYYKGRTETCRSCSIEAVRFIETMENANTSGAEKAKSFKVAANRQMELMNEARKGNGIDRHLFGLWCAAYDNDIPIPELYDDPLYSKSGGGGNFVLSTSTLGYAINCGFVAPMCTDGYGCFYTMLEDCIWAIFSAYRDSTVTSGHKFQQTFHQMKASTVLLLLVASSCCFASPIPRPAQRRAEIPEEVLDLVYESFVLVFRTVQATYPPELLQEAAKELLASGGHFQFSDGLNAQLEEKTVELRANLKHALEDIAIAAAGLDASDDVVLAKVHDYLDYAVDVMINAVPMDTVEALVVEVLQKEGSFDFTPELEAMLGEALAAAKVELRKIVDYEFELFEDLIGLDEELRVLIYQIIDYLADETYQAIPWKLLEDIVYDVIEKEGVIDLTDELNERVEETLESLRQKLREVLESLEAMFFPKKMARVVSDEVMQIVYESIVTMLDSFRDNFPNDVFQDVVHTALVNGGQFAFSDELSERLDVALENVRSIMQSNLVALVAQSVEGAPEDVIERLTDYFEHATKVMFEVFPADVLEEIVKEVLANGGVFDFSDDLLAMIDADLVRIKESVRELFAYEFAVFPELQELTGSDMELIYRSTDYVVDEVYKIMPWSLFEEIVYTIVSNDGVVDFSSDLVERIDSTLDQMAVELKDIMDKATDLWE